MMNQTELEQALSDLPLGGVRYYPSVGSTNDLASQWADEAAPDFALVLADQQTSGRGRLGRQWVTRPGVSLAFSLVLRLSQEEVNYLTRFAPWGAVAVCDVLQDLCDVSGQVKWPNDVLVGRRKLAGILVESQWTGDAMPALIVGIGINIAPDAVPPDDEVIFPASCVESACGKSVDRVQFLHAVLAALIARRPTLGSEEFLTDWNARLAFLGEWVQVGNGITGKQSGRVLGVAEDGQLRLETEGGAVICVDVGDVHMR
jgi:BirA family biotin operon repressor/biotin-[acetyl-CoA-carboxylase] ligase